MEKLFDEKKFRASLPIEMLSQKRFVRFFLKPKPEGGTAKIPLGNHSDPKTWENFNVVATGVHNEDQGIGYCFLGGEIHGLDIDHCRNPKTGRICPEAMVLLSRLGSWAEYSVSGQGIHVFFKGSVRGKQLGETCLQYWNPKNSPRFFALTCDMVGEAFTKLKDVGDEFNYIFATARHISAKIREELKTVDYEQWAALPAERVQPEEEAKEKPKTKSRKVAKDFDIHDFLKFYGLGIDNETDNELGHCIRLTTCPIKGEPHVGQNSTTTNFVLSNDGGLGFHCQSTGCVDWSVAQVIEKLAKEKGPYPNSIYEVQRSKQQNNWQRGMVFDSADAIKPESTVWLWPGYLPLNMLVHFAGQSAQGKSPVTLDIISRLSTGAEWPDGTANGVGPLRTILLAGEDHWPTVIVPRLLDYGANLKFVERASSVLTKDENDIRIVQTALKEDVQFIEDRIKLLGNVGLIVIDPITNYLGGLVMNKEEDIRSLLMPLADMAQRNNVCVVTVGHLNKRNGKDGTPLLDRIMGAAAFKGVARQVFLFGDDPEDDDRFKHIMNFGRPDDKPALRYKTTKRKVVFDGGQSDVIAVEWLGAAESVDVDESIDGPKKQDKTEAKRIAKLVVEFLKDGMKLTEEVAKSLQEAGVDTSRNNWQRCARKVAKSGKGGPLKKGSKFYWWLPTNQQSIPLQAEGRLTTQQEMTNG
jgi:hypothetical protein